MKTISMLAASLLLAGSAAAADAPAAAAAKKNWTDSAEGSFVNANGNSKATTTSGKNTFVYDFDALTRLHIEGGALGSRSQGQVTAEQYYGLEKLRRKWDPRDYVFQLYRWDKNRFAKIANRHEVSLGVGRELWKTAKDEWLAEAGPGFVSEERIGEEHRTFASARAYAKYTHDFSPTAKFSQDGEYLQSLKDKRDNRFSAETALTTTLTTVFSLKTSFVWKHVSQPPPQAIKDDTLTSVALIANF